MVKPAPLPKLLSIAKEFTKAAMNKANNWDFEGRVVNATTPKEMSELFTQAATILTLKQQLGANADSNLEYAQAMFKVADYHADIYARICTPQELAALIPKGATTKSVIQGFKAQKADNLVRLFSQK